MQVFRHLDEVPANYGPTVLSIGNFDGVHIAHQAVVRHMAERAHAIGGKAVAVTFEPHPLRILRPDSAPKLLSPLEVKLRLLENTGVDAVLVLPFTRDLSLMSAHDFARNILVDKLQAREVHEGYNFHFGHKAEGNVERLAQTEVELIFVKRLRDEKKFESVEALKEQIGHDVARAQQFFRLLQRHVQAK